MRQSLFILKWMSIFERRLADLILNYCCWFVSRCWGLSPSPPVVCLLSDLHSVRAGSPVGSLVGFISLFWSRSINTLKVMWQHGISNKVSDPRVWGKLAASVEGLPPSAATEIIDVLVGLCMACLCMTCFQILEQKEKKKRDGRCLDNPWQWFW